MICIVDPQLNNYNMFSGIWIFKWYEWSNNSIIVTSSFPKFICCFVLYFHVAPNSQNDVKIKLMGEQMETAVFYCNTDSLHILLLIYNENGNCKWQAEGSL